jgi:hypothetical protein
LHYEGCRASISLLSDHQRPRLSFSGMLPFELCPLPLLCRYSSMLLRIGRRLILHCLLLHADCSACFCRETSLGMGWFH